MKSFKELLYELFDKPWSKEVDFQASEFYKNDAPKHYVGYKITNVKAHKLEGDNGHLLSFHRDGVLEAHHIHKSGVSGKMLSTGKNNPRFVSTMIHHLKTEGLDKGRPVRVSTTNSEQAKHYRRIIDKKFGDTHEIRHHEENIGGRRIYTSHISDKGNSIIESMFERYKNSRREDE